MSELPGANQRRLFKYYIDQNQAELAAEKKFWYRANRFVPFLLNMLNNFIDGDSTLEITLLVSFSSIISLHFSSWNNMDSPQIFQS